MRPCSGIRVAGTPSFCTKRWVFSDTLEKYTRLRDCTATSLPIVRPLRGQRGPGERLDAIGPEARPVVVFCHHHGGLQIAQRHHVVPRLGIQGDVDLLVRDALLVQRLVGGGALHACGLGVDGDAHLRYRSFAEGGELDHGLATTWILLLHYVQRSAKPPDSRRAAAKSKALASNLQADFGRFTRPGWLGDPGICRLPKHYT